MNLTPSHHTATICPTRNSFELGRGNPISNGDNTPQFKAVFLCLSFLRSRIFGSATQIMMALFGQSFGLVVPLRDISTPFNAVANAVESFGVGNSIFSNGFTA